MGNANSAREDPLHKRNKSGGKRRFVVAKAYKQQANVPLSSAPGASSVSLMTTQEASTVSLPQNVEELTLKIKNRSQDESLNNTSKTSEVCQQMPLPVVIKNQIEKMHMNSSVHQKSTNDDADDRPTNIYASAQETFVTPSIDIANLNISTSTGQCSSLTSSGSASATKTFDSHSRCPVLNAYPQSLSDNPSQTFTEHLQQTDRTMMSNSDNPMLQTVFKWDRGGQEVFVKGTFTGWKPIKMVQSQGDFFTVVDVPEGHHEYRFIVDGQEKTDPTSEFDESNHANILEVKKSDFEVFEALENDIANEEKNKERKREPIGDFSGSPPGVYSQDIPTGFESNSRNKGTNPPVLPPYLLEVILNNPKSFHDKILLPQPNHVMLNHLYALSIQDGVMVMSDIHRYRNKYVTTLFYKPI